MARAVRWLCFVGVVLLPLHPAAGQPADDDTDRKLRDAFGPDSPIVRDAKIKVELSWAEGRMIFTAKEFAILPDGTVKLTPGNAAFATKEKDNTSYRAHSTYEAPVVVLTFDRPVKTVEDMRKAQLQRVRWPSGVTTGAWNNAEHAPQPSSSPRARPAVEDGQSRPRPVIQPPSR